MSSIQIDFDYSSNISRYILGLIKRNILIASLDKLSAVDDDNDEVVDE